MRMIYPSCHLVRGLLKDTKQKNVMGGGGRVGGSRGTGQEERSSPFALLLLLASNRNSSKRQRTVSSPSHAASNAAPPLSSLPSIRRAEIVSMVKVPAFPSWPTSSYSFFRKYEKKCGKWDGRKGANKSIDTNFLAGLLKASVIGHGSRNAGSAE